MRKEQKVIFSALHFEVRSFLENRNHDRQKTTLTYNDEGDVTSVIAPDCNESYTYDDTNMLTAKVIGDHSYTFTHKDTATKELESISVNGSVVRPSTDVLGKHTGKTIEVGGNKIAEEKITYAKFGDHATSLPASIRYATNGEFRESMQYRYDSMGNIIEVSENGRMVCRYEYDALNRLTREDNVAFGKTTTWVYDNNGNILARYEYAITTKPTSELHLLDCETFEYGYADNSDQLLSYNGEAFVYDLIGNPTTYRGKTATWAYGRQLTEYDGNTFAYDARGQRIAKNDIVFTYDSNGNLIKQSNGLKFLYDHTGVFAVKHGDATYFYRKNAQNDVIALLDNSGAVVVKYKYDAWGNCDTTVLVESAATIAELNPFRYRSYYFDTETGFYFLKTRYYDPVIGRFMTIDDIGYLDPESINGLNLYAYCINNPLTYIDPLGCSISFFAFLCLSAFAGMVLGLTTAAINDYRADNIWFNGSATDYFFYGIVGLVTGLVSGLTSGWNFFAQLGITFLVGFTTSMAESIYLNKIDLDELSTLDSALKLAIKNGFISALSFTLASSLSQIMIRSEYLGMIGNSKTNLQINRALAAAGHKDWKIGNMGLQAIYHEISNFSTMKSSSLVFGFYFDFLMMMLQQCWER